VRGGTTSPNRYELENEKPTGIAGGEERVIWQRGGGEKEPKTQWGWVVSKEVTDTQKSKMLCQG